MYNIAIVYPKNIDEHYRPNNVYEPTSVLGLYNILKRNSNCIMIDGQALMQSADEITEKISNMNLDYLLLSSFDTIGIWKFLKNTIKKVKEKNPNVVIMVGGAGATHSSKQALEQISPEVLIIGEGEVFYQKLVENEFDFEKLKDMFEYEIIKNTIVFKSVQVENMDTIDYERNYEMELYNYTAMPNYQRGCIGTCIYCTGCGHVKIRYKSPKKAFEELKYLVSVKKVTRIFPLGPDFTANVHKGAEIIKEFNRENVEGLEFVLVVRLDTLYKSMQLYPEDWKIFTEKNQVVFQIGIESFVPKKLMRLGKYKNYNNPYINNQADILQELMDKYSAKYNCFFILIDPLSTLEDIKYDMKQMKGFLKKYPTAFLITGKLFNVLEVYPDTKAEEMFKRQWTQQGGENIKRITELAEKYNMVLNYSKRFLVTDEDYVQRANEQISLLENFWEDISRELS